METSQISNPTALKGGASHVSAGPLVTLTVRVTLATGIHVCSKLSKHLVVLKYQDRQKHFYYATSILSIFKSEIEKCSSKSH